MSLTLFRKNLLRIDKSHGRRNLDYADMIHDKSRDEFFKRTIEMVQYNAAIIMVKWLLVLNYIKSSCNDEWTTKSCNDEKTYPTSSSIQKKTKAFSARIKYFLRTLLKKVYIVKRFRDKKKQKNNFFGT